LILRSHHKPKAEWLWEVFHALSCLLLCVFVSWAVEGPLPVPTTSSGGHAGHRKCAGASLHCLPPAESSFARSVWHVWPGIRLFWRPAWNVGLCPVAAQLPCQRNAGQGLVHQWLARMGLNPDECWVDVGSSLIPVMGPWAHGITNGVSVPPVLQVGQSGPTPFPRFPTA